MLWGLVDNGIFVKGNLSSQPYVLFDSEEKATQYVIIHNSGYTVARFN
jgi:hypothetical protein